MVRVRFLHHLRDPDNGRLFATAMVDQYTIPELHFVAQEIPCLIVPHPFPIGCFLWRRLQITDGKRFGFRFEQPIAHGNDEASRSNHTELNDPLSFNAPKKKLQGPAPEVPIRDRRPDLSA